MLAAFLLLNLAAILAATALNLPPAARAHAWPLPADAAPPPAFWIVAPVALAAAAAALIVRARRGGPAARRGVRDRALLALLAWPLLFAGMGGWSAADRPSRADWLLCAGLAAVVVALVLRARARGDGLGFARARFRPALRAVAPPTLLLVAAAAAWGLAQGRRPAVGPLLLSLAGYPLWSLLQLLVLLALPWPLLHRAGASGRATIAGVALLFALAHWPNGPLMLACLVAMAAWAGVWARRPSLPATALAMGLAATALIQLGPADGFDHARVGPRLARWRLTAALAAPGAVADTTDAAALVRACFPATTGRAATAAEEAAWARALGVRLRERIAWQFLTSDELRALAPNRALPRGERFVLPPPGRRGRIATLGSVAYHREAGGNDRAFLRAVYRDVLEREPSPAELDGWAPAFAPNRAQRRALAATLFDARRRLRAAPGDTLPAARLRVP